MSSIDLCRCIIFLLDRHVFKYHLGNQIVLTRHKIINSLEFVPGVLLYFLDVFILRCVLILELVHELFQVQCFWWEIILVLFFKINAVCVFFFCQNFQLLHYFLLPLFVIVLRLQGRATLGETYLGESGVSFGS